MCASEWKNKWRKTIKKWGKLCVFSQNSLHNKDNINVTCVNTDVLVFCTNSLQSRAGEIMKRQNSKVEAAG